MDRQEPTGRVWLGRGGRLRVGGGQPAAQLGDVAEHPAGVDSCLAGECVLERSGRIGGVRQPDRSGRSCDPMGGALGLPPGLLIEGSPLEAADGGLDRREVLREGHPGSYGDLTQSSARLAEG